MPSAREEEKCEQVLQLKESYSKISNNLVDIDYVSDLGVGKGNAGDTIDASFLTMSSLLQVLKVASPLYTVHNAWDQPIPTHLIELGGSSILA